jgi:endonuclease/exonuclease/phosphatase (EEP) superfamily protein YafD
VKIVLLVLGLLMVGATALPLVRRGAWWIRVFDFPRIQITLISAAVVAAQLLLVRERGAWGWALVAALAACLVYQSYMIFPYTFLARRQVQQSLKPAGDSSFSLLFANVLMENRNAARLRELVRGADPDIILTVEADEWWMNELKEFEQDYEYVVRRPQPNTYGMLLYSRLELLDPEVRFIIQDDIPSIHARVRLRSGQEVELHCLHPRPPFPTEDTSSDGRDAELLVVGKEIKGTDRPTVVMGDLNDVAWSHTNYLFQDISGLLDPRIGRGFYNTFHARYPFVRFPLDHFFHSNHFRLIDFRRLPYFGSDHFPVFIALSHEPDAERQQEELRPDASEVEEAEEKIEQAA